MEYITFKTNATAAGEASAAILRELPEIGDTWKGRTVLEVGPCPLTEEQDNPEAYRFSIWKLHLSGQVYDYVAVCEEQAEHI